MGCGASKPVAAETPEPPKNVRVVDAPAGDELYKASRIIVPLDVPADGKKPALVLVHGNCTEADDPRENWEYLQTLGEYLAVELGVVCMIIGMHDDDAKLEAKYPGWMEKERLGLVARVIQDSTQAMTAGRNAWPAKYYGDAIALAIENLVRSSDRVGVSIDEERIALVGHSMGGAGVLYAAGVQCKDKIKAVAALNPSHLAVETPFDGLAEGIEYGKGEKYSGENGAGTIAHLANIIAPCYVYGSRAEYNTTANSELGAVLELLGTLLDTNVAGCWPEYHCVYGQVGSATKELYVDDTTDCGWGFAHNWMKTVAADAKRGGITTFAGGEPISVLLSFLRRHVLDSGEPAPVKPGNAYKWAPAPAVQAVEA